MARLPQNIETIIKSFEKYAIGDIQHNRSKPIAAFILSICFIDQLSSFRYNYKIKHTKRAEKLINDYMKDYKGLDLYDYVRNSLVHNYSSKGRFDIDNIGYENSPFFRNGDIIHINTNVFISHLEDAFKILLNEFRDTNSDAHKNAIETSKYYPVFVDTRK
ncbi:MAG: hypothetical protein IPN39_06295 [Chitinophagaceae bacterium]|nr:hypothetical protein [Chitinophagaceae bacterium]